MTRVLATSTVGSVRLQVKIAGLRVYGVRFGFGISECEGSMSGVGWFELARKPQGTWELIAPDSLMACPRTAETRKYLKHHLLRPLHHIPTLELRTISIPKQGPGSCFF